MSKSVFKGEIKTGSISATFNADASNAGSDLLTAQYADFNGDHPQTAREAVAPGGAGTVTVNAPKNGLLEIMVVASDQDGGQLQVRREGKMVTDEPTRGAVRWVYSVAE